MTSFFDTREGDSYTAASKDSNHNICHQHRNVLKSKENTYNNKCRRILKRKLKKYKLRQDGKEDQDIIDVSDTLTSSLLIRSPNKAKDSIELETETFRKINYLFTMVKRKQMTLKVSTIPKSSTERKVLEDEVIHVTTVTEEKKTNAFKLLMESRNKSIGTNSPGKDKPSNETDSQEIIEKKSMKAKRNLMLHKMAEEKGSLKKKEIEEQHEKYINKKMEKRAEKLKSMILHKEPKPVKEDKDKRKHSIQKERNPLDSIDTEKNEKVLDTSIKTLQLVNVFNETVGKKDSPEKKLISKEEEEFLKKLSPSLRKKESMLSYFKKIDKEPDIDQNASENDNAVIKVKLGTKSKKKGHKKKLSLKRDAGDKSASESKLKDIDTNVTVIGVVETNVGNKEVTNNLNNTALETNKGRRKRKRAVKESSPTRDTDIVNSANTDDKRPKRTVKRPIKYSDDIHMMSSDDELVIFTPKKKKHSGGKEKTASEVPEEVIIVQDAIDTDKKTKKRTDETKHSKNEKKSTKEVNSNKPVKLAPIFSKTQPDAAALEAKQKFLQSGVPEQLKKMISKQMSCNILSNSFPTVVHVQQLDTSSSVASKLLLTEETNEEEFSLCETNDVFVNILNLTTSQIQFSKPSKNNVNKQAILQKLKETYPRFPVYRTFKLLRDKKKGEFKDSNMFSNLDNSVEILNCSIDVQNDNPDQLTWSDKYKPLSGKEIIGNFESIKELKKWLVTWTENDKKCKVSNGNDSDSSDYYQSEADSRDSLKSNNNLLVLAGPIGCGKTSAVYAVAAELSIKVIEVNASSKRTGKIMLQDLQEATQSHKVNRGTGSSENSQKSQEILETPPEVKMKKRGRPKKVEITTMKKIVKEKPEISNTLSASQESTRTAMSLILIDDADIVFDQDDGFCSAITQLVQCSKRPVILVTGSLTLPHLQKFLQCNKILKMQPLLPNMLGTWLDLMCLADSGICWPSLGAKFLNLFKGDMRKTINCLQFYVGSQEEGSNDSQTDSQNSEKIYTDDENSCISWADRDTMDDKNTICSDSGSQSDCDRFMNEHINLKHMKSPLKMFDIWWSLPKLLSIDSHFNSKEHIATLSKNNHTSLECISNVLDSISICDFIDHRRLETEANMTLRLWYDGECNSVSELENLDLYDKKHDTMSELCMAMVRSSITAAQESMGLDNKYDLDLPGMSVKRQKERIVARHMDLTSYLSPQSYLDRGALALDYWSSCRSLCRIEKSKTDTNSKRNNRFCHYLKSLSMLCKTDTFENLANGLNPSGM